MTTEHPITPSPELIEQWRAGVPTGVFDGYGFSQREADLCTQAARWGADQELEACVQHVRNHQWGFVGRPDGTKVHTAVDLELARRPKPRSLKEQALDRCNDYIDPDGIIRRALEALPDV